MILLLIFVFMVSCCPMVKAMWDFPTVNMNVSDSCKAAIHRLSELEVNDPQLMAYYWDSWGKPSDGILTGHTTFLGYYDECIDLRNTALKETKYCIYSMIMETDFSLSDTTDSTKHVCSSSECPTSVNMSAVINIKVGVCFPSQCSSTEFASVLSKVDNFKVLVMTTSPFSNKTNSYTIKIKSTSDSPAFCPDTNIELDRGTISVMIVCAIFIGLVIVGTTVDFLLRPLVLDDSPSKLSHETEVRNASNEKDKAVNNGRLQHNQSIVKDLMLSFSLYNTVPKLVSTKQSASNIKGLHALKVLFNVIIVMNHVYAFVTFTFSSASQNTPQYLGAVFSRYIFQPILNASFSVDTFFLASATLSAYLTFKDMEKHKKFRCTHFYLNRFFRLSPMYYLFTFIAYKLSVHFGQGPIWHTVDYLTCKKTWWYNIFYFNNVIGMRDMCMLTTWYTSVDMQLFVISPIFIMLLYSSVYYGLSAIFLAATLATTTVGYIAAKNGYWAAIYANPQALDQFDVLYIHPFYRINTYMTGILLGYILYKKYNLTALLTSRWLKQLIYIALWTTAVYLCTVQSMLGNYGEYSNTHHFTDTENITFLMFSGLAWSIGLSIIIYICNTGYGGIFGGFLSWPGWDPMARLTFGVYLIHPMVLYYILGTLQSSLKYTDSVFVMISMFSIMMSYSLSAVTALCVEFPIANVVSLCFRIEGRSA